MTTGELVALARDACQRAELQLTAARRAGNAVHLQLARLHWECTLRDLHRALMAVES